MKDWQKILVRPETSLTEVVRIIDAGGGQIALVTDSAGVLLGALTDADIRKAILRNIDLNTPCAQFMSTTPYTLPAGSSSDECLMAMGRYHVRQLPLVDDQNRIVDVVLLMDLLTPRRLPHAMVIMAGGLGSRLAPLTNDCPKPLLKVGKKPLLETILEQAIAQGFHQFFFSVNYKSDMIKAYFGDGSPWGVTIDYLVEQERTGTAGSLSLLPEMPTTDLVVMNGDILTKVDFNKMLQAHHASGASATMAVKDYELNVPYGVVEIDHHSAIKGFREKPSHRFFVNAGIYVLSPSALQKIPRGQFFDMPALFDLLMKENLTTSAFPLREYWMDIGQPGDYDQANSEYDKQFLAPVES